MEGISSILEIASGKDNQKFAFSSSEKNWKQIFIKNNYFVDLLVDIPKFWDFFAAAWSGFVGFLDWQAVGG